MMTTFKGISDNKIILQSLPVPISNARRADIVGFGVDGVVILRNAINVQAAKVINNFGYNAGGWRTDKHVRLVGDTTGDGNADVVGFGEAGVWISVNNGDNSFQDPPKMVIADFSYVNGCWRVDKHIRYLADIRRTGRCDIVGFGDAGVVVSKNNGGGSFSPAYLALNDLGYNGGGWRLEKHLRFLGDVNGNGLIDIIGFGDTHVFISRNKGDGTFAPVQAVINDLCYDAGGWRIERHPRFIADLTGDGRVDIIGFGDAGAYISLNNGTGTFGPVSLRLTDFGCDQGWRVGKHPRWIADVTGDKCGDIVGFGEAGVYISINQGGGIFGPAKLVIKDFGYAAGGWRVEKHPRFAVDLTGDGRADIIGFGENSVFVSYNDGKGNFGPVTRLIDNFAFSGGWTEDKTVRFLAGLSPSLSPSPPPPVPPDRVGAAVGNHPPLRVTVEVTISGLATST